MAVGDVYEVIVQYQVKGEHCENVFRYKEKTAEADPIPAENLVEGFYTALINAWKALVSEDVNFNCIYGRRIAPAPGIAWTKLLTDVGEVVSDAIPSTSALLMTWYTALVSKRGRGRNYFAGLPENAQEGGKLEGDVLADWQALSTTFIADLAAGAGGTGVWELAVWSEVNGTAGTVIQGIVRTNLATMRSRRQRPGTS